MARYRLSGPAETDIAAILKISEQRHGREARTRYRALLTAAMRRVAANPEGPATVDCGDLWPGARRLHIRFSRSESPETPVANPVHVIFYRELRPGLIEIVRVLHERMDPIRHLGAAP